MAITVTKSANNAMRAKAIKAVKGSKPKTVVKC